MAGDAILAFILSVFLHTAGDNASLYYGRIEPQSPVLTSAWRGNPYWDDEEYHSGEICYDGVLYDSVMLRYNIMSNEVVVLTPERQISVVPDQNKISYFAVEGKRYERLDGWFVSIEADGAYDLLHARVKEQGKDAVEDGHVVHTIRSNDLYYLRDRTGKLTKVSSLKSLCRACPEYAKELKALKKTKRLKFKGKTLEQDLIQCVSLLNSYYPTTDIENKKAAHRV